MVVLVALTGYAFAAFTTLLSTRILQTAPIRLDLATSVSSTAVNVGITLGALIAARCWTALGADDRAGLGSADARGAGAGRAGSAAAAPITVHLRQ